MRIIRIPEETLNNSFNEFAVVVPVASQVEELGKLEVCVNKILSKIGYKDDIVCSISLMEEDAEFNDGVYNFIEIAGKNSEFYIILGARVSDNSCVVFDNGNMCLMYRIMDKSSTSFATGNNITLDELQEDIKTAEEALIESFSVDLSL